MAVTISFYDKATGQHLKDLSEEKKEEIRQRMWETLLEEKPKININYGKVSKAKA